MSMPDASVIIPICNGAKTITAILASLVAQHFNVTAALVVPFWVHLLYEHNIPNGLLASRVRDIWHNPSLHDAEYRAPDWQSALSGDFTRPDVGAISQIT